MKRGSTTDAGPVDKKKNHKGQSYKTVWPGRDDDNDTGDSETKGVARCMTKGMRPGTGKKNPGKSTPAPYAERNRGNFKTVASKDQSRDSGADRYAARVHAWVRGGKKP